MQELIERINERKIKLWIGLDGELHYRAPKGALSPELAGEIRQNKGKVVEFLKRKACEHIEEVAEKNNKIEVAEAKWGEDGIMLQIEPESIQQNYNMYNLAFLHEKMSEIWKSENADIDANLLKEWIETAERVALGEMWKVMLEHDFFVTDGQYFTVEEMESKIGVADKYKRFFRRWLQILKNKNFIKEEQGSFCGTSKRWDLDMGKEWDRLWELEKQLNYGKGFVTYLEKCSKSLTQLFRNEIAPLELLFPHGEITTAVDTYQKTLSSKILNHMAECVVLEAYYEKKGKVFRILEVGAGVGGTSDGIIERLSGQSVEYYYTDVSTYFLNKAKERYQGKNWVKYKIFDINKGGMEENKFDLIICANVLHNAKNGITVLRELKGLINEEGLLVILDAVKEPYYLLTSIEFNDGLSDFDDFRNEDNSIFFERRQWEYMFRRVGLDIVAAYPKEEETFFGLGQGIFVLGVQNHHMEINTKELHMYLKQHLEEYEVPNEIKIVSFLNTEKLMNKLPRQKEVAVNVEQPQTELEMQLEKIWKKVLNREKIGRHENFFTIGGDSLLLSQIIAKMWDSLPETKNWSWGDLMREILETPTIAEMANKIQTKEKSHEALTTLIEGTSESRIVYVMFHAGTGSLVPYMDMIKILRERKFKYTVLGISCREQERYLQLPFEQLFAKLGEEYAELLKKYKDYKLYFIGHCIGGLIAIETAKELLKQGAEVELVTMISTNIYGGDDKKREENFQILQSNLILEKVFGRLIGADIRKSGFTITDTKLMEAIHIICQEGKFTEEKLVRLTGEYQEVVNVCKKLLESSHQERLRDLFSTREGRVGQCENEEDREVLFEIFKHNLLAALYYKVTDYCGNIKLLRCRNQTENFFINIIDGFSEDDMVWRKSKVKNVVAEEIQGDHISCMEFPYIKENINLIIEEI